MDKKYFDANIEVTISEDGSAWIVTDGKNSCWYYVSFNMTMQDAVRLFKKGLF